MSKDYFARYKSPNIVIVPTVSLTNDSVKSTATVVDPKSEQNRDVSSTVINNTYVHHNVCDTSSIARDSSFDSVEEALKKLHSVQTPTKVKTHYNPILLPTSKYSDQKNLIDITTNNNIRTDTDTNNENKQEINNTVVKHSNINVEHNHLNKTEQPIDCTQPNITSINQSTTNMISTNSSHKSESEIKHTSDKKSLANSIKTKIDDISNKIVKQKKREDHGENSYIDNNNTLKLKPSSNSNEYDVKKFNLSSKYKIPMISKKQKKEYEHIESHEVILSQEKKEDITPGALKRYLNYQRFLGKCYEKNEEKSSKNVSNVKTERARDHVKTIKENVKSQREEQKQLKVKSKHELMKKKQEYRKKLNSCIDRNISCKPCTSNDNKKTEERSKEKNKERRTKKEEIRIKLTSYIASKKQKENASERNTECTKNKNSIRSPKCSDRKEQSHYKHYQSSKHKSQKENCNSKVCNKSERKKAKDGNNKMSNKIKEMGMKRKYTDSEQEIKQKSRKLDTSTNVDDSGFEKRRHRTSTPIRIVDVLKQTRCHNLPDTCSNKTDLRSKLTRKRTLKPGNENFDMKSLSKRENLLVTLKQQVQSRAPASSNSRVKKCKEIKLVINIKCPDSNIDFDETESEISNGNSSPQQDLSFLDDIDIDGIVDSLNAGQKTKSPIEDLEDLKDDNMKCSHAETQEKDCVLEDMSRPLPLIENKTSSVCPSNNPINAPVLKTEDNHLQMEYNDDVYEVIDITDENENNIILVDDDEQNTEQTLVTQIESPNKADMQEISIIHIQDDSRDSSDVITITDVKVEEKQEQQSTFEDTLPRKNNTDGTIILINNIASKTSDTQIENNDVNVNSESVQNAKNVTMIESNSSDAKNVNIERELDFAFTTNLKKEFTDVDMSLNIKNEANDAIVVAATDLKQEVSNNVNINAITVKKEISDETLHIKSENTEPNSDDTNTVSEVCIQDEKVIKTENNDSGSNKHESESEVVHKNITNKTPEKICTTENDTMPESTKTPEPYKEVDKAESVISQPAGNTQLMSKIVNKAIPTDKIQAVPGETDNKKKSKFVIPKNKNTANVSSVPKTGKIYNIEPEQSRRLGSTHRGVYLSKTDPIFERLSEYLYMVDGDILLDSIHRGHFSNIYKCKNPNGAVYAVKVLKKGYISLGMYKQKILWDLQKVPHTDGNNILEIIKHVHLDGWMCFKTDYYPKTLAQALYNRKPFDINTVQNLSRQLVSAVKRLTCNYIVHSDIKPKHILLNSREDRLKLCGFERADYNYNIKIIPSTGSTNYRAPEIILGFDADYKIDVWATAAVMYEMASGTKLFPGNFNNEILYGQMCISGPVGIDMLEKCTKLGNHFKDNIFMRQVGPKTFVSVTDIPVKRYKLNAVLNTARSSSYDRNRTLFSSTESTNTNKMLLTVLGHMLVINPRNRISIVDVASNEFLCKT